MDSLELIGIDKSMSLKSLKSPPVVKNVGGKSSLCHGYRCNQSLKLTAHVLENAHIIKKEICLIIVPQQ